MTGRGKNIANLRTLPAIINFEELEEITIVVWIEKRRCQIQG